MEADFEGEMQDVPKDKEDEDREDEEEEEGDADRIDQQMGDAGDDDQVRLEPLGPLQPKVWGWGKDKG